MARKTKLEAEETREQILNAAEQMFYQHGVSRTTLEKIATAAGVTRGAIYWHFANKSMLFSAMLERIRLPFQQMLSELDSLQQADPLAQLRAVLIHSLEIIASCEQHQRVLSVVFHRCEYIDELNPAVSRQEDLDKAACGIHAYMGGLIRKHLLQPEFCDLSQASGYIDLMLQGIKKPA